MFIYLLFLATVAATRQYGTRDVGAELLSIDGPINRMDALLCFHQHQHKTAASSVLMLRLSWLYFLVSFLRGGVTSQRLVTHSNELVCILEDLLCFGLFLIKD